MGNVEKASNLLHYWISQHRPEFDPDATSSFEATVAHSIQEITAESEMCSCKLIVTSRLQNNYGTMNGGCMAALTCIMAGAALDTVSARSGIVTSSSMDCLSSMPGHALVEVIAKVTAVTSASASVEVILRDAKSQKLVAKGRYTEQAPHTIRATASAYLTNAASAARSAVQRLQTAAESALQRADHSLDGQSDRSDADKSLDIRHKAMASLTTAGATVRAAAHRLQLAADSVLRSSSADPDKSKQAELDTESVQEAESPSSQVAKQAGAAASTAVAKVQAAAQSTASTVSSQLSPNSQSIPVAEHHAAAQTAANAIFQHSPDAQTKIYQEGGASQEGTSRSCSSPSAVPKDNPEQGSNLSNSPGAVTSNGHAPERAKQALLQRIAMVKDSYRGDDCSCFDTTLGCLLKDIKVSQGQCSAVLPTSARLSNYQGQLHAGCYCSLVDLISTTALAAADKRQAVSVTISVDFYAPLPIGEDLEVEAHMVKPGKTLTFAEINFRQRSTGELIAQGSHVEYSAGGAPYPASIEEYHRAKLDRQTSKL